MPAISAAWAWKAARRLITGLHSSGGMSYTPDSPVVSRALRVVEAEAPSGSGVDIALWSACLGRLRKARYIITFLACVKVRGVPDE